MDKSLEQQQFAFLNRAKSKSFFPGKQHFAVNTVKKKKKEKQFYNLL